MPIPSPFPPRAFTPAYDALVAVLREDEMLSSRVMKWRTWSGETDDADPPSLVQMPWVRLTPSPSAVALATEIDQKTEFIVRLEMAVQGTDVRHMLNFWDAIQAALIYAKPHRSTTARRFLQDEGNIIVYRFVQSGIAPVFNPGGWLEARSAISLTLYTPA